MTFFCSDQWCLYETVFSPFIFHFAFIVFWAKFQQSCRFRFNFFKNGAITDPSYMVVSPGSKEKVIYQGLALSLLLKTMSASINSPAYPTQAIC